MEAIKGGESKNDMVVKVWMQKKIVEMEKKVPQVRKKVVKVKEKVLLNLKNTCGSKNHSWQR